ncbi:MAG: OmpH family outer membrane protein [Candidatus Binatia bacterium]|nr:OmpH family outer membrane protein [Candidatus Binatia bacterium]
MRALKWIVPVVALALTWAAPALAEDAATSVRIGYVDLQKALMESKAGKKAKADFKVRVDKLEKRLQGKKTELEKMKEDLERRAVVMREEERRKLADEFERKRLDLKLDFEDSQAELQKKDQELTGTIVTSLQAIIKEIGDSKGYTLILELGSSPVLYFKSSDDITAEVLKKFDARS